MKDRSKQTRAGGGEAGPPAEPPPALAGSTARRDGPAERKALLDELASRSRGAARIDDAEKVTGEYDHLDRFFGGDVDVSVTRGVLVRAYRASEEVTQGLALATLDGHVGEWTSIDVESLPHERYSDQ